MVINRLRDTPITVPTVCWLDRDDKDLGTPYYVMEQNQTIGTDRRCARVGLAKPSAGQAADAAAWRATVGTGRRLLRRAAEAVVACLARARSSPTP
jgi:aminoglycoside phosphotransferase (APT) family kinase protein